MEKDYVTNVSLGLIKKGIEISKQTTGLWWLQLAKSFASNYIAWNLINSGDCIYQLIASICL